MVDPQGDPPVIPTDAQIRTDAEMLGFTDRDILRLLEHARRARTGNTERDGFKRSHGAAGSRASGISNPTCDMAIDDEQQTPEVEKQQALLFDMFQQAVISRRAVRNTLDRLDGLQSWQKPVGHTSSPCKSVDCDGPSVARGWCDPCRKWIARNPTTDGVDPVTVPGEVIAERTKRRAKAS
jgi:hypothetical protein